MKKLEQCTLIRTNVKWPLREVGFMKRSLKQNVIGSSRGLKEALLDVPSDYRRLPVRNGFFLFEKLHGLKPRMNHTEAFQTGERAEETAILRS